MKTEHRYTIDGVTYDSLDDMPPEVRAKWTSAAPAMEAMEKLMATARTGKWTNVRVERTTTRAGAHSADTLTRAPEIHFGPSPENPIGGVPASSRIGRAVVFFSALAVVFGLGFLGIFSRVHLTVRYDYRWWALYAALLLTAAAAIWRLGRRLRQQPALPGVATARSPLKTAVGGMIAVAVFAGSGLFGGIPILGHYATARPGEMTVTVTGKAAHAQRTCTYRLNVREFTFFADDYLCVSDQAFDEISVGSELRLEGKVSPFGIEANGYRLVRTGN